MSDERNPDKLKGPGGIPMRELHELVKKGHARDQSARAPDKLKEPRNRWQRFVRYVWDRKRGRG